MALSNVMRNSFCQNVVQGERNQLTFGHESIVGIRLKGLDDASQRVLGIQDDRRHLVRTRKALHVMQQLNAASVGETVEISTPNESGKQAITLSNACA